MARRARKGVPIGQIVAVVGFIAIIAVGGFFFLKRNQDPYAGLTTLDMREYTTNSSSLMGGFYRVTGEIAEKMEYTAEHGQVVQLRVEDASMPLVVKIPPDFNGMNIDKGQKYTMRIEVQAKGIAVAHKITKS